MSKSLLLLAAALVFVPSVASAQLVPFQCGPDCSTPGRYVLCNDNFDVSNTTAGGIVLSGWLDAACTSFPAPAPMFNVVGFVGLFGGGEMFVSLVELFEETDEPRPVSPAAYDVGAAIPFSATSGFSGLFFGASPMTTSFRICVRQQVDDPGATFNVRPMLFDDDGQQNDNYVFLAGMGGWQTASQVSGDFILRPIVTTDDTTPWDPGGICDGTGRDGGVPQMRDGGPGGVRDGGPGGVRDGGPGAVRDAGPAVDAGPGGEAPTIMAVSPDEGDNGAAVDVLVTGSGFIDGLTLKIGTIPAGNVTVAGSATIMAEVPANIAAGPYDVIVTNPDGQSAILPDGYTVLDKNGGAPVAEGCACDASDRRTTSRPWLLLLLLPLVLRRRR